MRYLKLKTLTTYMAALLILAGCASENLPDESGSTHKDSPFYLTFELSQPGRAATRAAIDKEGNEGKLSSLVAVLTDTDDDGQPTIIQGIGAAVKSDIGDPVDGKYTVILNMGIASLYAPRHKYRLFVFANLNDYSALLASHGKRLSDIALSTTSLSPYSASQLNAAEYDGLPFSTTLSDASAIQVYLEEGEAYTATSPYVVHADTGKADPESEEPGILKITPLHACLEFVEEPGITGFTYAVGSVTHPEVKVRIKSAKLLNAAKKAFLMPQGNAAELSISSPSAPGFAESAEVPVASGKAFYSPEYMPALPENGIITFRDASYLELEGILIADEACTGIDPEVRKAISEASVNQENSPSLFYFDDGTFQSALTLESHAGEEDWRELKWNAPLGGYAVTYRHAIRHDAGEGKNIDDGTILPMEYGVVRNHLYEIGIRSVSALPHKFSLSDPVENSRQEISVQITPAKWTGYHRGAIEIEY